MAETLKIVRITSGNQIKEISLAETTGKTLRQMLLDFSGQDILAKIETEKGQYYFCGTERLLLAKTKAGAKAVTFEQAVRLLDERKSPLLDIKYLPIPGIEEIFPEATIEEVTSVS